MCSRTGVIFFSRLQAFVKASARRVPVSAGLRNAKKERNNVCHVGCHFDYI